MPSLMRMPNLCAQCGKREPDVHIQVEEKLTSLKNLATMSMGMRTRVTTMRYAVPLCNHCRRENRIFDGIGKLLVGLGWLMVFGSVTVFFFNSTAFMDVPTIVNLATRFRIKPRELVFVVLFVLGFVVAIIGGFTGGLKVASTDGKTFRFYNKDFQAAFAELNPRLVQGPTPSSMDNF